MAKYIRKTTADLDDAERKLCPGSSAISRALRAGGLRIASGGEAQTRKAGLADRFYNPHAPVFPGVAPQLGKHDTPDLPRLAAQTCPRCRQVNITAKLANGTSVSFCQRGCRYAVPLPTTDLVTNN
jgi:hypothetical protein